MGHVGIRMGMERIGPRWDHCVTDWQVYDHMLGKTGLR